MPEESISSDAETDFGEDNLCPPPGDANTKPSRKRSIDECSESSEFKKIRK